MTEEGGMMKEVGMSHSSGDRDYVNIGSYSMHDSMQGFI
jgi:hypothetical protein